MSTTESVQNEWFPSSDADWRTEIIDLTSYVSDPFNADIRLAFVTTNGNGNNLFLDNIQVFPTAIPNLVNKDQSMVVFPNPSTGRFSIAMGLPVKEPVALTIIDLSGRVIQRYDLLDVLNQRFEVNLPELNGVYLVNVRGEKTNVTQRILIGR